MRKKILVGIVCLTIVASILGGCGEKKESGDNSQNKTEAEIRTEVATEATTEEVTTEITPAVSYNVVYVDFEHEYNQVAEEYAYIVAYDKSENIVWSFLTPPYAGAQCMRVWEVGLWNDRYVYVEDGCVIAIDRDTGTVMWTDSNFGGGKLPDSHNCFIDDNGYVYVSGAMSPDLYVISPSGECVYRLEEAGIDFPEIEFVDGKVRIYGYDDYISGEPHEVFVDVSSFTNSENVTNTEQTKE